MDVDFYEQLYGLFTSADELFANILRLKEQLGLYAYQQVIHMHLGAGTQEA